MIVPEGGHMRQPQCADLGSERGDARQPVQEVGLAAGAKSQGIVGYSKDQT